MKGMPDIVIMGSRAGYSLLSMTLDRVEALRIFPVPNYGPTSDASDQGSTPAKNALGACTSGVGSLTDASA